MDKMISLLKQDLDSLKFLVKVVGYTYRIIEINRLVAIIEELEKRNIITEKVIQALLTEVERIEYLSDYLYRKNEAKQLRAIIELIQEKT